MSYAVEVAFARHLFYMDAFNLILRRVEPHIQYNI